MIFIISFLLCGIINYSGATSHKAFLLLFVYLFYILTLFKDSLKKRIFTLFVFFIIVTFSEIFTGFLMNGLTGVNYETSMFELTYIFSLICSHFITFLLSYLYIKLNNDFEIKSLPKYTWIIFVLPVTTIFLLTNINDYYNLMENNILLFFIVLGLFISNFIIIYIFLLVVQSLTMKRKLDQLYYQKEYISNSFSSHFNCFHNIINELNQISDEIKNSSNDTLKKQVNDLMNYTYEQFNILYTNSPALNSVINSRINEINLYHIKFDHTLMYIDFDYLDYSSQVDLF